MALEKIKSVVNTTYRNSVSGYDIQYRVTRDEGEAAKAVIGSITKDGKRAGSVSVEFGGIRSVYIESGVPDEDSKTLYDTALTDAAGIFASINGKEG